MTGTVDWITKLVEQEKLTVLEDWKMWDAPTHTPDNKKILQGGIWKLSSNFTFMTFNGAGHMVPQNKRLGAQEMMRRYLHGEL
jgi:carboxypeptidase C (cathepsin A)